MCDEKGVELSHRHTHLPKTDRHAATSVDEQLHVAGFHQRARSEAIGPRRWGRRAEQRYPEIAFCPERQACAYEDPNKCQLEFVQHRITPLTQCPDRIAGATFR